MNREITLNFKGDAGQLNQVIKTIVAEVKSLDGAVRTAGGSPGSGGLFGKIVGSNLTSRAISEAIGLTKDFVSEIADLGVESVKLAGNFQVTTNALAVFTGSTRLAKEELAAIDKLAANTPGLRLVSAEEGYQKLRALGFQADITKKLVQGLGNQKILSGADDAAVDRVIVNLTQIRASSKDASRDIKEMIKAIPSLSGVFQDTFGTASTSKLRGFLQEDPQKFFDKLATGLANAEHAEGGLNDAFGKLEDAFVQAERAFGEPILEPLTDSIKDITKYLEDNKGIWKSWGEYVGDIIRGLNADAKDFSNQPPTPLRNSDVGLIPDRGIVRNTFTDVGRGFGQIFDFLNDPRYSTSAGLVNELSGEGAAKRGKLLREQEPANKPKITSIADLRQREDKIFSPEALALRKVADQEKQRALENAKQKELALLKDTANEAGGILKNRYEREQAIRELATRYTAQQEIAFLQGSAKDKTAYLDSEIGRVSGFYNKQIELQKGSDEEIAKLTSEKNRKVGDLETEKVTSSARTAKQIQDLENRIYEERRQAAIEFAGLQIKESASALDKLEFDLNRSIERQSGDSKAGFDALKTATQKSYEEVSALTKAQYEKQLQNLSLTDEQRTNILKEMYLTEQDLAEKNRRSILQIEEDQYRKSLSNLETVFNRRKDLLESYAQSTQFGIGLLSPDAFAANSSSLIQKSLTGNDLSTLKRDTQDSLYLQKLKLAEGKKNTQIDLDGAIKSGDKKLF